MMSGQYVPSHGYYGNWGPIPDKRVWVAGWLRRHGDQTAIVGKAHYGYEKVRKEFDFVRLCDRADIDPANPMTNDYFKMLVAQKAGNNTPFRSKLPKELSLEWWTGYCAIEFLRGRDRSKPFFAHFSFERPHLPITPPAPYDTMCRTEDVPLPPSAREDLSRKPVEQKAAAVRSAFHKNSGMYEAIVHIPYIASGPGMTTAKVSAELVEQVDIFPTACGAVGVPVPESVQCLSLLKLDKWPREAAFHETEERKGIRTASIAGARVESAS